MQIEQQVIRLEAGQHQRHLSMMRSKLKEYHGMIQNLTEYYKKLQVGVPLSSYINFRDALCHYAAACHHEELIALRQESNALEEHLHRAVKDMAVNYLQVLADRILEVYSYEPSEDDTNLLELDAGVNIYDYAEDLARQGQYKAFIQLLHRYYVQNHIDDRKILQKWLHEVRDFDLIRRDASLRIEKPFSAKGLKKFYDLIADCKKDLESRNLYELVFLYGDFFDPDETRIFLED